MIKDTTFNLPTSGAEWLHRIPARFAPVVPLSIAKELQDAGHLGNYHLLLAHDVLAHPADYENVYAGRGYTILMDNSLVELGYAMPIAEVLEAAKIVGAQYLVLPDKLSDMEATIDMTLKALGEWGTIDSKKREGMGLLPVLQGKNMRELNIMLNRFCMNFTTGGITGMCVPRVIADTIGTRSEIIALTSRYYNIHMLGFSENFLDDIACARMPGVVGIDSAVPVRAGLRGLPLSLDMPVDPGKRECYWENPYALPLSGIYEDSLNDKERFGVVCDNIFSVRKWIRQGRV